MRVTFLLHTYPKRPIGGFRVVYEHAGRLSARGHEVTVVHPRRLPDWNPPPPRSPIARLKRRLSDTRDALVTPAPRWHPLDPRVRLQYVPQATPDALPDADAVFATFWATAEVVAALPPSKGRKFYLIQHHEVWDDDPARVEATWRLPLRKVVVARWLLEKARSLGVPPTEIAHVPNGVDTRHFRPTRPIEARAPVVAMIHSRIPWKGSDDGIRALVRAKRELPRLEAILAGSGRKPASVPAWMEWVRDPDHHALVDRVYNRASILLCPSWSEGWYLPAAEAMACGCALVSTDMGGVHDYAVPDETVLLSPPRDPAALAANLLRVLRDDALRVRLATRGHAAIQAFTWERSARALEALVVEGTAVAQAGTAGAVGEAGTR